MEKFNIIIVKTSASHPPTHKPSQNLGMKHIRRRFLHGLKIGGKAWNKKVVLRTASARNGPWDSASSSDSITTTSEFEGKSTSNTTTTATWKATLRENNRIKKQYWSLIHDLRSLPTDDLPPTPKELKRFLEAIIKREYLGLILTSSDRYILESESFQRTAKVVSIVAESMHHWENQVGDYGDIGVLANYLYDHVWVPAGALRVPVDKLIVMFDLYYESWQRDMHQKHMAKFIAAMYEFDG